MIPLPRFTLLVGPETPEKHALVERLCELNPDVLPMALDSPIDAIAHSLFCQGKKPPDSWISTPIEILNRPVSIRDWWADCEKFLRSQFGPQALGRFCVHNLISTGDIDIYDNFLIPDVVASDDIFPFENTFKPSELLYVFLSFTTIVGQYGQRIVLASPDSVDEQIAQITRELSPLRAQDGE